VTIKRFEPGPRLSTEVVHTGTPYLAGAVADDPTGDVFLGTPMVDLDLEAVEWTREWVAKVKDEPCKGR
jgi:hypothetical protein